MTDPMELLTPRILAVDDERQIHASLRLRLAGSYDLVCCADANEALKRVQAERFDLCIVDIHMPRMNGLRFIESAQQHDPALGYLLLSAFDTDDNLHRAISLQVYEFLPKPLPESAGFEQRIPEWIERTRRRRRELSLARDASTLAQDLGSALLERDVELIASESARDALLQTAGLLTTIHAHLVTAATAVAARARHDSNWTHVLRGLEEARKTADAAVTVAEGFFDSAYGNRDTSAALVKAGLAHAAQIASRIAQADEVNKAIDLPAMNEHLVVRGLSGIDFLLMMTPPLALALTIAGAHSTVGVTLEELARMENVARDVRNKSCLWLNRKSASLAHAGVLITITAAGPSLARAQAEAWLKGEPGPLSNITARGLVRGIEKCRGLMGIAVASAEESFRIVFSLPV